MSIFIFSRGSSVNRRLEEFEIVPRKSPWEAARLTFMLDDSDDDHDHDDAVGYHGVGYHGNGAVGTELMKTERDGIYHGEYDDEDYEVIDYHYKRYRRVHPTIQKMVHLIEIRVSIYNIALSSTYTCMPQYHNMMYYS